VSSYCPYPEPARASPYSHIPLLISNTEDKLHKAAYQPNQIITEHGLTVFVQKIKLMAFRGRDTVRSKMEIDNKILKHVQEIDIL
jgi:hypothetical protein